MIFVDSNIWCYYFDSSAKEHENVSKQLEKLISTDKIFVNTVVLMEVSHYLVKSLGSIEGKKKMDMLLSLPLLILDFDYKLLHTSVIKLSEYSDLGIGGRDATILAAMQKNKIKQLLTHDKAFSKVKEIEVFDPVLS